MIKLRELEEKDNNDLEQLIEKIENGLSQKEWWLPISEKSRKDFFNKKVTRFIGAEDDGKIVAACGLFLAIEEFKEETDALNIDVNKIKVAEIGRCMVLPEYRGNNLMFTINMELINLAKNEGVRCLVATAHPDNNPSNMSFQKLGFEKCDTRELWAGYLRNIYKKNI